MGIDLTIVIEEFKPSFSKDMGYVLGHNTLSISRDYDLFRGINALTLCELDIPLYQYDDEGLRKIEECAYGAPLQYVTAGSLSRILVKSENQWDWGVGMFLDTIKPETRIVLYWH